MNLVQVLRSLGTRHSILALLAAALLLAGCDLFQSTETRLAKAEELMAAREYREAMIELKNVLAAEPENAHARLRLAEASLQVGDVLAAQKELDRAVRAGARTADAATIVADILLAAGDFRALLAQIDSGELPIPSEQIDEYRGRAWLGLREYDAAVVAFEAAIQADANNISARVGLAETHAAMGVSDTALAELDAVLKTEPGASRAWLVRGSILAQRGEFDEARQSLENARAHADREFSGLQRAALLAMLTETHLARGDSQGAREAHAELRQFAPDWIPTRLLAARIALMERKYQDAVAGLQPLVAAAPDVVPAQFLLGAALLAQGSLNQAEQHLSRVLQQAPDNLEARKLLAQARLQLRKPDNAMQILLPVADGGADPQLDAMLGLAYLQQGETSQAIAHLEKTAKSHPNKRDAQLQLASAYIQAGELQKARALLAALPHVPNDARRESLLVSAVAGTQGIAAARKLVDEWIAAHPQDVALLNFAATFFARQGEVEGARSMLGRAATIAPNDVRTLLSWARLEVAAGDHAAARSWLEKLLEIEPDNAAAHIGLAELAMRNGDLARAREQLESLSATHPKAIEPRLRLIRIYLQQNDSKSAQETIREALEAAPGASTQNAIGLVYLEANRYEEALARFREAAVAGSGNGQYWLNVARAQLALGHMGIARESLRRSLVEQPDWPPAVAALALLDIRENKREAAIQRVRDLRQKRPGDAAVMTLVGDVHAALEQYEQADAAYTAALAKRPDATLALKSYAARQRGKLGNPLAPLEQWVARVPDDFSVRTVLADAYQRAGQRERAIEQYELIVRNRGDNIAALNNLAWMYYESGDARAVDTARLAYEKDGAALPQVADTYGWVLVQTGKVAEGLAVLQRAVAAAEAGGDGIDPEIEYHLAYALHRAGRIPDARHRLERLLGESRPFASRKEAEQLLAALADLPAGNEGLPRR